MHEIGEGLKVRLQLHFNTCNNYSVLRSSVSDIYTMQYVTLHTCDVDDLHNYDDSDYNYQPLHLPSNPLLRHVLVMCPQPAHVLCMMQSSVQSSQSKTVMKDMSI